MARHLEVAKAGKVRASDTGSFRRLVEHEISVEEYVRRLDERVRERDQDEERPRSDREPVER